MTQCFLLSQQGIYSRGLQSQKFHFWFLLFRDLFSKNQNNNKKSQLDYFILNFVWIWIFYFISSKLLCLCVTRSLFETLLKWKKKLHFFVESSSQEREPNMCMVLLNFILFNSLPLSWSLLAVDIQINNVVACFEY